MKVFCNWTCLANLLYNQDNCFCWHAFKTIIDNIIRFRRRLITTSGTTIRCAGREVCIGSIASTPLIEKIVAEYNTFTHLLCIMLSLVLSHTGAQHRSMSFPLPELCFHSALTRHYLRAISRHFKEVETRGSESYSC